MHVFEEKTGHLAGFFIFVSHSLRSNAAISLKPSTDHFVEPDMATRLLSQP